MVSFSKTEKWILGSLYSATLVALPMGGQLLLEQFLSDHPMRFVLLGALSLVALMVGVILVKYPGESSVAVAALIAFLSLTGILVRRIVGVERLLDGGLNRGLSVASVVLSIALVLFLIGLTRSVLRSFRATRAASRSSAR